MKTRIPPQPLHGQLNERRLFLKNLTKASLASFLVQPVLDTVGGLGLSDKQYSVGDVMDLIIKEVPGAPFKETVDTLKSGDRTMMVTGIVTTMFSTVEVIRQAAAIGANFIIAHEPTFYNHTDDVKWVTPNHIVEAKQALLEKNRIAVWRLHDYLHSFVPDGVSYGVAKAAGWLPYFKSGERVLKIPKITLGALAAHLKSSLNIKQVRVIGAATHPCESVVLMPGAAGGKAQIAAVEKDRPDVLIVGEVHEWETAEYIRDTQLLGGKTTLIVLGHSVSEEPGLQWLRDWLQPKIPSVKIQHIVSGNPFTWI